MVYNVFKMESAFSDIRHEEKDAANTVQRERRKALYQAFRDSPLHPQCSKVYYPACGTDDAIVDVFPESEIIFLDTDKNDVDAIREKHVKESGCIQAVQASAEEYKPTSVDLLLIHGSNYAMIWDAALASVIEEGYVLTGDDAGDDMREHLIRDPRFEFVGVIREEVPGEAKQESRRLFLDMCQVEFRQRIAVHFPKFFFDQPDENYVLPISTDEELRGAVSPRHFEKLRYEREIETRSGRKPLTTSVLGYARTLRCEEIPRKRKGALLYIFQRKKEDQ